ncbi:tetratricopeptide repeat protein [Bradyrhizobium sp. HKCCYLS2038]|uniref:tetratricopeptide repeat protein n=1 Tax=unclassified Bradyrhizobium TaxID=2631580 RepID=UPI003EBFE4A2
MTTPSRFVIVLVLLLGLMSAAAFQRQPEQISTLAADGRYQTAIRLLNRQLAERPHDASLLAALARSHAALGEYDRAISLYDQYLAARPDDLVALQKQYTLLIETGLVDRYFAVLAHAVEIQPSPDKLARLIALYRLHGRTADELTILTTYAKRGLLQTDQLERLGALLASESDWRGAQQWLAAAESMSAPSSSTGRLLLLEVLLQNGERDRALRYARQWMIAWRDPFLSGKLILRMAKAGLTGAATELASEWENLMPATTFDLAGLFISRGHSELARVMLARWADRVEHPSPTQLHAFVLVSARLDASSIVVKTFLRLLHHRADRAALARLAEDAADTFGTQAMSAIRPFVSTEMLLARPLFAARLSLSEGNRETARWFLNRCDPNGLTPEEREKWLGLLQQIDTPADAVDRLVSLWQARRLPIDLAPELAKQALVLGRPDLHDAVWRSLER